MEKELGMRSPGEEPTLGVTLAMNDGERLSTLVREHRARMLGWAKRYVNDRSLAEDVVQEALLRVLKRMDSLRDPAKLLSWLHAIVRNEARMALRKNGRIRPEGDADTVERQREARDGEPVGESPEQLVLQQEGLAEIRQLLGKLGERERSVLEAHAFAGLATSEVAEALGLKPGAVYTALSRARRKIDDARFDYAVEHYKESRRRRGKPYALTVDQSRYRWFAGSYNSMAASMLSTLQACASVQSDLTGVLGATGHAFRFQATADVGASGIYAYDWRDMAETGWRNLGFAAKLFGGAGERMDDAEELTEAMEQIHASLESGVPVMAWQLARSEFGLIVGFDDREYKWLVTDSSAIRKSLPYTSLGRGHAAAEWFAAIPYPTRAERPIDGLRHIFLRSAAHIAGKDSPIHTGFLGGSAAYHSWLEAFSGRSRPDRLALAYGAAYTAEARVHATLFLQRLLLRDGPIGRRCDAALPAISEAYRLYESIAAGWQAIARLFPLPFGGNPAAPGPSDRAARLLEQALAGELAAAQALTQAASRMDES